MDFFEKMWYPRESPEILFLGFNQDGTCLTVGSVTGFSIYSIRPFKLLYKEDVGAVTRVEMLFSTDLVSLVGSSDGDITSCRILFVWNTKSRENLANFRFDSPIHLVKMNPKRLVVGLERELRVYDLRTFTHLHIISYDCNYMVDLQACCLSPATDNAYLVVPASNEIGKINIIDIYNLKNIGSITAHENAIKLLAFNVSGTLLATASIKGTVIRIWSIPNFEKLWSCRRSTISCTLYHLAFSTSSEYLISTGSSGSVYLFKLDLPEANRFLYTNQNNMKDSNTQLDYILGKPTDYTVHTNHIKEDTIWNTLGESKFRRLSDNGIDSYYEPSKRHLSKQSLKNVTKLCKTALHSLSYYLPNSYRENINAFRCVAWVSLGEPCNTMPSIAIINQSTPPYKNQVFVASYTGCAYLYEIPTNQGEGRLKDEYFLTKINEDRYAYENLN